ncbi:MAG: UbiA family prenyltransferase [Halovenus sp.]
MTTRSLPGAQGARNAATAAALVLVQTNLFISLAATSVAVSTVVLAGLPLEPLPLFIVFAVTLFVYSFNRLADRAEDERNVPGRAAFVDRYGKPLFAIGIGLYIAATVAAVLRGVPGAPAMILPLTVAVLYSIVGLKRILLVKNLLVGVAWGLIPLGVGVYYSRLMTIDILFMTVFVTVMLTIAAVVFDIKDIEGDRAEGIRTVPIVVGPERTRRLAAGATAVVGVLVAALVLTDVLPTRYGLVLPFVVYVLCYCPFATEERGPLFYGFVVDGEHLFLVLLLLAVEFGLP